MKRNKWPYLDDTISIRLLNSTTLRASRRMVLLCVAVIVVPISLCLVIYSLYSASTMEKEIFRNMLVTVEQGKNNIDFRMEQIEGNALSILSTVYPYLNSDAPEAEQLQEYNEVKRLLAEYQDKPMVAKIRLYVPPDKRYSRQGDIFYSLDELLAQYKDQDEATQALRGTQWIKPHTEALKFGDPPVQVLSCQTSITSTTNYEHVVGSMFIDVRVADFGAVLSAGIGEDEALFLVSREGRVLCHPDAGKIGTQPFPIEDGVDGPAEPSGSRSVQVDGAETLLVYTRLDATDWYLVMTVPRSEVYSTGFFTLDMVRIAIILVIIISFVVALAITYQIVMESTLLRINRAINELNTEGLSMAQKQVEKGPVAFVGRGNKVSSLATLERNANRMVLTIKSLLDIQYRNEIAVRDYQMQALQAQINPHFLYNTLDIIKWMIADGKKNDSIWMVNSLSRYFQLSLNKGRDIVRIEEEIGLTKTYVGIMQKRFEDVFEVKYLLDPNAADCLIPKLSLQPLVENALLHGILYSEKPERWLYVCVFREGDEVCVEICDSGNGMDEATLQAIRDNRTSQASYGISNVRKRLELFGAEPEGFGVISSRENGTCVTLRLPARQ